MNDEYRARYKLCEKKISAIAEWSIDHPEFDIEFLEALRETLDERGTLSNKQLETLDSLMTKWGIDE